MNENDSENRLGRRNRVGMLGVSYLEMSAALFVFSVGIMGAFQMFHFGLAKMRMVKENDIALRAIQNEVESLRAVPFDRLLPGEHAFISETPEVKQLVNALPSVRIEPHDYVLVGLKRIRVSLAWTGDNGRTIARSVDTLVAEKGVRP